MAEGRQVPHHDEAIVLRTWPFHEADLLVSLFTREQGKVKGVARHAMRSRRRFGGALEPGTQVRAHYTERPREELVRLDSFEIVWSPLTAPVDTLRLAGLQLVLEVLDEAMPELAAEDSVFRLAVAVLRGMGGANGQGDSRVRANAHLSDDESPQRASSPGAPVTVAKMGHPDSLDPGVWVAVTYFCVWMCRLMGWWPELGHCAACGMDLRGQDVWWSPVADGVTCADDRGPQSKRLSAESVAESYRMGKSSLAQMAGEEWPRERAAELYRNLGAFAVGVLERHLERRLRSAAGLE
ncbi:MAG TPA: DNA repair protein RecO [Acidobacteriaceae bacterium]|nr:DNA repair protein RecO [Acidobacteriaceae bacterium]